MIALLFLTVTASAQDVEKIIRKGNRNYRNSDYAEAIDCYKEALKENPINTKAWFNLGTAYYGLKQFDSAYFAFDSVVMMSPEAKLRSDALFNMGNCLLENKMYLDAFNHYKRSLKENPENQNALYNLEYCRAHLVKSNIIVKQPEHGFVAASAKRAFEGEKIMLTSQPEEGYSLSQYIVVRADDPETKLEVDSTNCFIMPPFDVEATAIFEKGQGGGQNQQQQDKQDQNQQQDKGQQDQQDKEQQQQDKGQQDQQDKGQQDQQDKGQQQNQGQQNQDQQQEQGQQMSKEDAQRMLDALENQEKKTMEKVNEQKVRQQPKKKTDKDW